MMLFLQKKPKTEALLLKKIRLPSLTILPVKGK